MSSSGGSSSANGAPPRQPSLDKPHPSEYLEFVTIGGNGRQSVHFQDPGDHDTGGKDAAPAQSRITLTQSNDDLFHGLSAAIPELRRLSVDAKAAAKSEHKMTFMAGIRLYPKAIAWSLLLSCTIVMEGYDTTLINSFLAFPVFRRAYGEPLPGHGYQVSPAWQAALSNGAGAGEIIGLMFNGVITDHFGYHKTMIGSIIWLALCIFLAFFAFNIKMLLAAQVLCGLSWGVFQTLSTTYAAEVMPVALRAYLTSNVNMCWLVGQLLGTGVIRGLVHNNSEWSYRIPFGLQWVFAVSILMGVVFAPESPWWLVRKGKPDAAKKSLLRLTQRGQEHDFNADETIAMMQHTNEVEKYLNSGGTSYLDCFRGNDRRRTEIACVVWAAQSWGGAALTGFAAYFYEQAGLNTQRSFDLAVGMYGLAIIGGMISWFLMRYCGRRTLYLYGLAFSFVALIVGGCVGTRPETPAISWTLGSLVIIMTFVYDMTIGPVCYTLVAEIPSTRLRVKTVILARVVYNLSGLVVNTITARMLNPSAWDWKGKSCFLFAGTCLMCLVWTYFRLPEPKGLTYMELDILFEKKAKTKKFKEFQVNLANSGYFSISGPDQRSSVWRGYG